MSLSSLEPEYDVLIVGGGITGAGVFREACRAGVRVLLVEARDYASGTSSWSSKLVHGGLRYLKSGDLRLTAESVRERQRLLHEAPDVVEPLQFLMPLYDGVKPSKTTMQLGLWLYDRFSRGGQKSRFIPAAAALAQQPELLPTRLAGAMRYVDARTDDCRLVWRLLAQGMAEGGTARNYTRVAQLLSSQGRVCGAALVDADSGETREVQAKVVVNATGVWANSLAGAASTAPKLRPLRGSHLVFPQAKLPLKQAVSWLHPKDGRPIFAYPWQGATLYGTTDLDHGDDLWDPRMNRGEVDYLLDGLHWLFPQHRLHAEDAISCFAGVRPIVDDGSDKPSAASRESAQWQAPGLVGITGGKLTTFRVTARSVLQAVAKQMPKLKLADERAPLFTAATATPTAQAPELPEVLSRLGEQVRHLDDLLLRRCRWGLSQPDGASAQLPAVLEAAQAQLGWTPERADAERQRYLALIVQQHRVPTSA